MELGRVERFVNKFHLNRFFNSKLILAIDLFVAFSASVCTLVFVRNILSDNGLTTTFNLTWMGEHTSQHHEIVSYEGNVALMRQKLIEVTQAVVTPNPLIDLLVPTGTAVENARTSQIGLLTRDCYHLSMDKGRYIAALTFIATITGLPIDNVTWTPKGVDEYALQVAIESANNAIKAPFEITQSKLVR